MLRHIVPKAATELSYVNRSLFIKDVTTENNWTFELVMGGGNDIPIKILVGFKQGDQINQQHQNKDDFQRPNVVNAQCNFGTEKFRDAGINIIVAIAKCSPAYGEIVSCFRHLAEDNVLQPYITQKDFLTSYENPDGKHGYTLYIFDIRHHQDFSSAQPIKMRFEFRPVILTATTLLGMLFY